MDELVNMANEKNMDVNKNGKRLTKKELYDILYYMYI